MRSSGESNSMEKRFTRLIKWYRGKAQPVVQLVERKRSAASSGKKEKFTGLSSSLSEGSI